MISPDMLHLDDQHVTFDLWHILSSHLRYVVVKPAIESVDDNLRLLVPDGSNIIFTTRASDETETSTLTLKGSLCNTFFTASVFLVFSLR